MNKTLRVMAVPALALSGSPAVAHERTDIYQTKLGQINGRPGSGTIALDVTGNQAHVVLNVSGMPATFMDAPYPHVQHIHGGAKGVCPDPSADKDGDKVISTTEGAPSYGGIVTTLSASGDTSPAAGLDPATLSPAGQAAKSDLAPKLPLAATCPALCGTLAAGMDMPVGGADTGVTQETGNDAGALALGGGLILVALACGAVVVRRRSANAAA